MMFFKYLLNMYEANDVLTEKQSNTVLYFVVNVIYL